MFIEIQIFHLAQLRTCELNCFFRRTLVKLTCKHLTDITWFICLQSGFTALHIASHYGNVAAAKVLVNGGANVNFAGKVCY